MRNLREIADRSGKALVARHAMASGCKAGELASENMVGTMDVPVGPVNATHELRDCVRDPLSPDEARGTQKSSVYEASRARAAPVE